MKNYYKITSLAVAAGFLVAGSTATSQVLMDLSNNQVPSVPGETWNVLGDNAGGNQDQDDSISDLLDSGGIATGFSLLIDVTNIESGGVSGAGFGGAGIAGPTGPDPFDVTQVTTDGLYANNNADGTAVFSFTNLAASTQYNFSAIGGRASNGKDGEIIILDSATPFGDGDASGNTIFNLLNDGTVLDFSTVSSAAGEIFFEFRKGDDSIGGTSATMNGLSMTAIPEPSAFGLLAGIFGFAWIMLRRR